MTIDYLVRMPFLGRSPYFKPSTQVLLYRESIRRKWVRETISVKEYRNLNGTDVQSLNHIYVSRHPLYSPSSSPFYFRVPCTIIFPKICKFQVSEPNDTDVPFLTFKGSCSNHVHFNPPNRRTKIGISHEPDPATTNASQLPECTRTFLYKFADFAGLGSELGLYAMAALTASMLNYTILIDDSRWNYGRLSDFFELPPLPCQPPPNWKEMPRSLFANAGLNESDHVYSTRDEWVVQLVRYLEGKKKLTNPLLFSSRGGCTKYILQHVNQRAIDVHSVWNFVNHRDQNAVLPATQNLHYSLRSLFDIKSEALRSIWRPNKKILKNIQQMRNEFNDKMLQSLAKPGHVRSKAFTPALVGPDSPLAKKLISVHFRLGDKKREVDRMQPAATGGMTSAFAKAKPFIDLVRSFVSDWKTSKNLPMVFVFSDDMKAAMQSFDEHQSYYYPHQRFPLLSPPETKMITDHGFDQTQFNVAPLAVRQRLAMAVIRDVTFAVDNSEAIVCTLSSNICNMMFHLRGSQDVVGRNPSVRSVDVRWYPTAFPHELNSLSLDPVKDRERILALAPKLAVDEENYVEI